MKLNKSRIALWALPFVLAVASCSDKKSDEGNPSNSDIANATPIQLPLYATEKGNTGYGSAMEIKSESADDKFYFQKERNSEWYRFQTTEAGRLSFSIEPNEEGDDFDFLLFKYSEADTSEKSILAFATDVVEKRNLPLRSNMAQNSATTGFKTGLACDGSEDYTGKDGGTPFSNAIDVNPGEIYYLVIDHAKEGGKGYSIRFNNCTGGGSSTEASADSNIIAEVPPPPPLPEAEVPVAKSEPEKNVIKKAHAAVRELGPDEEYYIVKPGNTAYSIATSHGMKIFELLAKNRMTKNEIYVGQKLIVKKYNPRKEMEPAVASKPAPESPAPKIDPPTPAPVEVKTPEPVTPAVSETSSEATPANPVGNKPRSTGAAPDGSIEKTNTIPEDVKKLYVYVNVVNAKNNNPVNTLIQVIDPKNKKIEKVPSNQLAAFSLFNDGGRKKVFLIDAFSFRKETFELDLDNIRNDSSASQVSIVNDTLVLNFELERYRKKDIFAAYNIFFYDDASVMLPKSKYELESLLEMLKENPRTKIRIHGHTNTNTMGKIISLEPGDHDFFRLSSKNKESFGTAQQLSKKRAESIKYYLQYHGVKDNRLDIKGWGGKKMIYEKDMPLAHKNKRVEIEILDE